MLTYFNFPGKLVEEEEGNFGLWLSYIVTGAGANLVSWLILPRNAVSVGSSGAVFGLFAISVLVKVFSASCFLLHLFMCLSFLSMFTRVDLHTQMYTVALDW